MDTPGALADRLRKEALKTEGFFSNLQAEDWQVPVYTEGTRWTVREVLAHFVTSERGFLELFKAILAGSGGVAVDFSIDDYNAQQQAQVSGLTPAELLEGYRRARRALSDWVADLSMQDLEIEGRHPFLGQVTLKDMLKMVYLHNQIHIRDLRTSLAGERA